MYKVSNYVPSERADETTTWDEHYAGNHELQLPSCSSHHTYRRTVSIERFHIWACPSCGRFSDTYTSHSGGTHIVTPTDLDSSKALVIIGDAHIPPSTRDSDQFGDGTMEASLLVSPIEAKESINAFRSDAEWSPSIGGSQGHRRWVPELNLWAIRQADRSDFIDHMAELGWITVDIPRLDDE